MSAPDAAADSNTAANGAMLKFGTIIVVGGGCYGSYYVRQLRRAAAAGAMSWRSVIVVDHDAHCAVSQTDASLTRSASADRIRTVVKDWHEFFREYLGRAAEDRAQAAGDAIVPSPLMPHLMFDWILERARSRWPGRSVIAAGLETAPDTPWQRATPAGPHYVSFADWICPINCVEPRTCPHTRSSRTWSLPDTARAYVEAEQQRGTALVGPVIFHCTHRAYGVGMFDTREVLEGDVMVQSAAEVRSAEILVGTMSHCHGAFQRLVIGAPAVNGSAASRHE